MKRERWMRPDEVTTTRDFTRYLNIRIPPESRQQLEGNEGQPESYYRWHAAVGLAIRNLTPHRDTIYLPDIDLGFYWRERWDPDLNMLSECGAFIKETLDYPGTLSLRFGVDVGATGRGRRVLHYAFLYERPNGPDMRAGGCERMSLRAGARALELIGAFATPQAPLIIPDLN